MFIVTLAEDRSPAELEPAEPLQEFSDIARLALILSAAVEAVPEERQAELLITASALALEVLEEAIRRPVVFFLALQEDA